MASTDDKKRVRVSSSQDEIYQRCKRLWKFLHVDKMPSPPKGYFDFGTILHEVCERYLRADDLGRDADGNPVELFPKDWDVTEGRRLPPVESNLIRKLIAKALDEGVLERRPGGIVEHHFAGEVIDGVDMVGFIDLMLPDEIQDHKTTKAMKWAKTPETLAENLQMLNYAQLLISANPDLSWVTLRHNVFCKDPDKLEVRRVETKVSRATIEANWRRLQRVAGEMKELREDPPEWEDVEGPSQRDACRAFGGCPMRSVCGGKETVDSYRTRVERQIRNWNPLQKSGTWDDKWGRLEQNTSPRTDTVTEKLNIFQRRMERQDPKASSEATEGPQINGASAPAETQAEASEAQASASGAPPWAFSGCKACGSGETPGLNSRGNPCRICDSNRKKAGGPTSGDYVIETLADGTVVWEARDGSKETGSTPLPATSEPKASEKVEMPDPAEVEAAAKAVIEAAKAQAIEEGEDIEAQNKVKEAKKPGRPRRSFRLFIDCIPMGIKTVMAEQVFNELAEEMAADMGADSYWDLDVFKRREAWMRTIGNLSDRLSKQDIVVRNPSGSPDLKAFVDALKAGAPAGTVIEGLS